MVTRMSDHSSTGPRTVFPQSKAADQFRHLSGADNPGRTGGSIYRTGEPSSFESSRGQWHGESRSSVVVGLFCSPGFSTRVARLEIDPIRAIAATPSRTMTFAAGFLSYQCSWIEALL